MLPIRDYGDGATFRRGIAAVGNSEEIGTWSGIPYHLLQSGLRGGFLSRGLNLNVASLGARRSIWQAGRMLHLQRPRGFQYSSGFLEALNRRAVNECAKKELTEVVSHYQLLSARYLLRHSIETSFYIDTTLQELFRTHAMSAWLNRRILEEAIDRERAEYNAAIRVVTMSSWVTDSVVDIYGVPRERVHTVLPGANLPEDAVRQRLHERGPRIVAESFTRERPMRIGFTGKDWQRKGLPRLVAAVELLNQSGVPARVAVIGHAPEEYKKHRFVIDVGFIDKAADSSSFIGALEKCDLGCAPSHEEPMGIAPLEYLRLGIPVLCTAAGGLKDVCLAAGPASILLGKDAEAEEIAAQLQSLARDPERLQKMNDAAWARKEHFSWDRTVRELQHVWCPARPHARGDFSRLSEGVSAG